MQQLTFEKNRYSIFVLFSRVNPFSTRNQLHQHSKIEIELLDGPFSKLCGAWRFESLADEACKISLDLEFEFSSGLTSKLLSPIFSQIANTMVDSFCARAQDLNE